MRERHLGAFHEAISRNPAMHVDGPEDETEAAAPGAGSDRQKNLSPTAARALAEAAARRAERLAREAELKKQREIDGRKGPDPVRYGDWENKGLASDF